MGLTVNAMPEERVFEDRLRGDLDPRQLGRGEPEALRFRNSACLEDLDCTVGVVAGMQKNIWNEPRIDEIPRLDGRPGDARREASVVKGGARSAESSDEHVSLVVDHLSNEVLGRPVFEALQAARPTVWAVLKVLRPHGAVMRDQFAPTARLRT
jgi:hypothetical protein